MILPSGGTNPISIVRAKDLAYRFNSNIKKGHEVGLRQTLVIGKVKREDKKASTKKKQSTKKGTTNRKKGKKTKKKE